MREKSKKCDTGVSPAEHEAVLLLFLLSFNVSFVYTVKNCPEMACMNLLKMFLYFFRQGAKLIFM